MGIETYSTTAANNTALFGEGWAANVVNDRLRTQAADLAAWYHDGGWIDYGNGSGSGTGTANTYTQISGTQFRFAGDAAAVYSVGRSVRAIGSATGTIYGVITASTYSSPNTTVTVRWHSGSLSSETITVYLSVNGTGNLPQIAGLRMDLRTDSADYIQGDAAGRIRFAVGGSNTLSLTAGNAEVRQSIAGSTTYGPTAELYRTNTGNTLSLDSNGDCALGQLKWTGPDSAGTKVDYLTLRAVAYDHQAHAGVLTRHGLVGPRDQAEVFFRRQATDIEGDQIVRARPPLLAQCRAAVRWAKTLRVDASRDHMEPLEPPGRQLLRQRSSRHGGAGGPVMKLAQIAQDGAVQPGGTIVAAVGVEVGAKVGADGQLQLPRRMQRRPTQRPLSGNVHHVRPAGRPLAHQQALGRQAQP
jgi:hypothetical protein